MVSFPTTRDNWNLDVVSILAVLGEHNIQLNSDMICLSNFCFLPRLIPAPQGFLSSRRKTLPHDAEAVVNAFGVHTGNRRDYLSYFANLLLGDAVLGARPFTVHELSIVSTGPDPIRPRSLSPLALISLSSSLLSFGLAAWAAAIGDGVALVGILVMSCTTPLLCVGLKWQPQLPRRYPASSKASAPPGDVVFRTANGAFFVVACDEEVSRSLFFHQSWINYLVSSYSGRGISGVVGGLTLVGSIVLFGNATWPMKAALVATYAALNLLYWLATLCPPTWYWTLGFAVKHRAVTPHATYTAALFRAIWAARATKWVAESQAVPQTVAWERWLAEAQDIVERTAPEDGPPDWDPVRHFAQVARWVREEELDRQRDMV